MIHDTRKTHILIIVQTLILLLLLLNISNVQPVNAEPFNATENISTKERTVYTWNYSGSCQVKMTIKDVCTLKSGCGYQTVKVKIETDESGKYQEVSISCKDCDGLYFVYNHTKAELQFHNKDPTSPTINALVIPSPFSQVISCLAKVLKNNIKATELSTDYGDIHFYPMYCYSPSTGKLIIKCCSEIGRVCFDYEWNEEGVLKFGGLYSYRHDEYIFYNELIETYLIRDVAKNGGDDGGGNGDGDDEFDEISLFFPIILLLAFAVIGTIAVITAQRKKDSELVFLEKRLKFLKNLESMIHRNATGFDIAYEIMEERVLDVKDPPKLLTEIFDLAKKNRRNPISTGSALANKIRENLKHIEEEIDWLNYKSERENPKENDIV